MIRIFFSACCYIIPFFIPALWPLAWIFPILLCDLLVKNNLSLRAIIIWSLGVNTFLLLPINIALVRMSHQIQLISFIAPLLLLSYTSACSSIWLITTRALFTHCSSTLQKLFFWTLSLWLYLLFLDYALLSPFGKWEGHLFSNPLLPAAHCAWILSPLSYVSLSIALLWFCCITSTCYALSYYRTFSSFACFTLAVFPWVWLSVQTPPQDPPSWLSTIGHLPLSLSTSISLDSGQRILYQELNALHQAVPLLQLVILPESSWNNAQLTHAKELEWLEHHPIKHVIIGSFADEPGSYFNSLYWFANGSFQDRYDKRQALPVAERIALHADTLCTTLYFQKSPPVTPSYNSRALFSIPSIDSFIPYICSELYCSCQPDDQTKYPILMTSNDSWFMPHFQKLMALAARFRAIQWRRPILYIGYYYAHYFDQWGASHRIATTPSGRMID